LTIFREVYTVRVGYLLCWSLRIPIWVIHPVFFRKVWASWKQLAVECWKF
jgi:hypothetical protein